MLNYLQVKTELDRSAWSKQQRERMAGLLPRLGPYALEFVREKLPEFGSEFGADRIIRALTTGVEWYEAIKQGQTREILTILNDARHNPQIGYGSYILPAILDIRSNPAMSVKITPELSDAMVKVETRFFKDLPEQQVVAGLQFRLLDLINNCSIVSEVKRYCYYHSFEEADTNFTKKLQFALEQNQEKLGDKQISLSNKSVEPTVRNWLSDFISSNNVQGGIRSSYNLIQYLTMGPNMKLLPEHEQATVAEIIKLYNWLLQPVIIENEIEVYEHELSERAERGDEEAPTVEERLAQTNNLPEVSGLSSMAEQQRIMEKIRAEQGGVQTSVLSARPLPPSLAKGISLDQRTNVRIPQETRRIQKQRDSAAGDIARKLEELRRRAKEG